MSTIEITLAGLLFNVAYCPKTYEVNAVEQFCPHHGWKALRPRAEDHVRAYLTPEVIMVREL